MQHFDRAVRTVMRIGFVTGRTGLPHLERRDVHHSPQADCDLGVREKEVVDLRLRNEFQCRHVAKQTDVFGDLVHFRTPVRRNFVERQIGQHFLRIAATELPDETTSTSIAGLASSAAQGFAPSSQQTASTTIPATRFRRGICSNLPWSTCLAYLAAHDSSRGSADIDTSFLIGKLFPASARKLGGEICASCQSAIPSGLNAQSEHNR